MRITINTGDRTCTIKTLQCGEVFKDEDGGYYLVINTSALDVSDGTYIDAVNLNTFRITSFNRDCIVTPVDSELIVTEN